jgi:hypothetical protein
VCAAAVAEPRKECWCAAGVHQNAPTARVAGAPPCATAPATERVNCGTYAPRLETAKASAMVFAKADVWPLLTARPADFARRPVGGAAEGNRRQQQCWSAHVWCMVCVWRSCISTRVTSSWLRLHQHMVSNKAVGAEVRAGAVLCCAPSPGAMPGWLTVVWATASATAAEDPPSVAALATAVAAASEFVLKVSARLCALALALPPLRRPW